jgi:hypothetical protein
MMRVRFTVGLIGFLLLIILVGQGASVVIEDSINAQNRLKVNSDGSINSSGGGTSTTPSVTITGQNTSSSSTNLNQSQNSSANATNVITLAAGAAGTRNRIYSASANCSAGTASFTITDGGTTIFQFQGNVVPSTPSIFSYNPTTPYTAITAQNVVVITVGACGPNNTSSLNVQADRY